MDQEGLPRELVGAYLASEATPISATDIIVDGAWCTL